MYGLTLGDFALVSKKAEYLGFQNNVAELAKLLKDELMMKSKEVVGAVKFGF